MFTTAAPACTDVAPSKDYTCAQQKGFGKCNEAFMKNYCNKSCGRCGAAVPSPAGIFSGANFLVYLAAGQMQGERGAGWLSIYSNN
jgi:ShK domain-like